MLGGVAGIARRGRAYTAEIAGFDSRGGGTVKGDGLRHAGPPVIRPVVGGTGNGRIAVHGWSTLESYRVVETRMPRLAHISCNYMSFL
jgi:hypothetical protein